MSFDSLRLRFRSLLSDGLTVDQVMSCFDAALSFPDIRQKETPRPDPDVLTMFLDAKDVEEKSKQTLTLYRSVISRFLSSANRPVASVTTADIRRYLSACKSAGHKNVTIGNTRRILSSFFEWCVLEGICPRNPVRRISAIRQEKSPRHAMKRIELEYLRNACADFRDKALVDFLYSTGARVAELCQARIENIDWEKKSLLIEHGKGNVSRLTYLNPECEVSLRAYLSSRTDRSPYIFARIRGSSALPLNAKSVQDAVSRIVSRSGRSFSVHITPHVFRHTIATVLLRNGMPVEQVQRFLGHANINTTMVYAEVSDDAVRRSHFMYAA